MNEPKWLHFGLYLGSEFVGRLSLEKIGRNMAEYHVITARRKVHSRALAEILRIAAAYLFANGFTAVVAHVPTTKRAAAILALRCGMREWGHTPQMRYFICTKQRFMSNGWKASEADQDAV